MWPQGCHLVSGRCLPGAWLPLHTGFSTWPASSALSAHGSGLWLPWPRALWARDHCPSPTCVAGWQEACAGMSPTQRPEPRLPWPGVAGSVLSAALGLTPACRTHTRLLWGQLSLAFSSTKWQTVSAVMQGRHGSRPNPTVCSGNESQLQSARAMGYREMRTRSARRRRGPERQASASGSAVHALL